MTASADTENGFPASAPSSMFVPSKTRTGTPTFSDVRNALGQLAEMITIFASPFFTALSACWTPNTTLPVVTAVFPQPVQANGKFTVIGEGLTVEATSPTEAKAQVTIDGVSVLAVAEDGDSLTAVLPDSLAGGGAAVLRHLQVKNPYDGVSQSFEVQCL